MVVLGMNAVMFESTKRRCAVNPFSSEKKIAENLHIVDGSIANDCRYIHSLSSVTLQKYWETIAAHLEIPGRTPSQTDDSRRTLLLPSTTKIKLGHWFLMRRLHVRTHVSKMSSFNPAVISLPVHRYAGFSSSSSCLNFVYCIPFFYSVFSVISA